MGVLALVVTITGGIIVNVAGTMFGTTGVGFANSFMAVMAARALIGVAMIVPIIFLYFLPMEITVTWLPRAIRVVWGTLLMYCIIFRAHDCGHVPAIVFAGLCTLAEAVIFWGCGVAFGRLILGHSLVLM